MEALKKETISLAWGKESGRRKWEGKTEDGGLRRRMMIALLFWLPGPAGLRQHLQHTIIQWTSWVLLTKLSVLVVIW